MTPSPVVEMRDTIPRMYHLTYIPVVLKAIEDGATFDGIRLQVWEEARAMTRRLGTVAAQPDDGFVHWSTTKDALSECMKLTLVERVPVPSKRSQVEAHRERRYRLTAAGAKLVASLHADPKSLRQAIAPVLIASHPYYAALLRHLQANPIALRTFTEEELRARKADSGLWVDSVAEEVARHSEHTMGLPSTPEDVAHLAAGIRDGLRRRFADVDAPRPKDVLDTVDDLACSLTLSRLGLPIDAISFNVLMSWSRWLYLADESRYVHGVAGRVIWAAADVRWSEPLDVAWRGVRDNGDRVAVELWSAYRDLSAVDGHPADAAPLLPIYAVRATTAFRVGVAVPVVDRILAEIVDGEREVPFAVRLAVAGASTMPASEPLFSLGDRPFFVMSLHPINPE